MTRSEMIKFLSTIEFRAAGTVQTMDMGLEFDYMSSKGCGTCLGAMGDWPAYKIRKFPSEKWDEIKQNYRKDSSDKVLAGTDLEHIAKRMNKYPGQNNGTVPKMVERMALQVKDPTKKDFFVSLICYLGMIRQSFSVIIKRFLKNLTIVTLKGTRRGKSWMTWN